MAEIDSAIVRIRCPLADYVDVKAIPSLRILVARAI